MDFGLSRRTNKEDSRLTQSGLVMGSPAYMSPEQVEGDSEKIGPALRYLQPGSRLLRTL